MVAVFVGFSFYQSHEMKKYEEYKKKLIAEQQREAAIKATEFLEPRCPVYQNVDGKPHTAPQEIKENLIAQLTAPVLWTKTIEQMVADGAEEFTEYGPGNVQQGLIKKIKAAMGE